MLKSIIDWVVYDIKKDELNIYFILDKDEATERKDTLDHIFKKLNSSGRNKVIDYATDLSNMHIYTNTPNISTDTYVLNAANQRTDINVLEGTDTSDDDIMDAEDF